MITAPDRCLVRHVLVYPEAIHLLRFILEAYEGIAVATTLDPGLGLIRLSIAPGCEDEVEEVLSFEKDRLGLVDALPEEIPSIPGI